MTTGEKVQKMRERRHWGPVRLAVASGISTSHLILLEANERAVTAPTLRRIAEALGVEERALEGDGEAS